MIKKLLIANRGEIALRILRACRELQIKTVAVHSTADRNLKHVKLSDESVCIGPSNSLKSYLNIPAIISAAELTDSDSIHPGYGFLSESSDFVSAVEDSGFIFIGPTIENMKNMGDKISAINIMKEHGISCIEGSLGKLDSDTKKNQILAEKIGYPIILKATKGGGGLGIRVVYDPEKLSNSIDMTKTEAKASFGDESIYMEKFLENPRHIEIQILGDGKGNAIHLGERDCSIQRRNQKVLEEAPSTLNRKDCENLAKKCVEVCKKIMYRGAGTFEFLYEKGEFFFIEMNTRIQVEHPVTEFVTGIDIVKEQLQIASNQTITYHQNDINIKGHSIQCRINAEDPKTFLPSPGTLNIYHPPGGPGIRVDSHIYSGYTIPPYYDSMIGKIISYSKNRESAIELMKNALIETYIDGIKTNIPLHQKILENPNFKKNIIDVHFLSNFIL